MDDYARTFAKNLEKNFDHFVESPWNLANSPCRCYCPLYLWNTKKDTWISKSTLKQPGLVEFIRATYRGDYEGLVFHELSSSFPSF